MHAFAQKQDEAVKDNSNYRLQLEAAPQTIASTSPILQLQRSCACGGGCPKCENAPDSRARLQAKSAQANEPAQATAPPIVNEVLRSSGQPLDASTRDFMESSFGHDFGQVKVHTDAKAAESATAVNALAYTVGQDVVFGAGNYEPETTAGKQLLAHELTHTIQQSNGLQTKLEIGEPGDQYEREADRAASAIIQNDAVNSKQYFGLDSFPKAGPNNKTHIIQRQQKPQTPVKKNPPVVIPKAHPKVATAAAKWGEDTMAMDSYYKFEHGERKWFFSPNPNLDGVRKKPASLTSFAQYKKLTQEQRTVIIDLAELDEGKIDAADWMTLKEGYEKWSKNRYAVFGTFPDDGDEWTCNIFLGDALYLAGITLMQGGKYYGAAQIAKGANGRLVKVPKDDIQPGDIISMHGGGHLEILTSVIRRDFFADGFCSRGGGRGDKTLGHEKCDTRFSSDTREIDSSDNIFYRVK